MKRRDPKDRYRHKSFKKQSSDSGLADAIPPEALVSGKYKKSLSMRCECGSTKNVPDINCIGCWNTPKHVDQRGKCFSCSCNYGCGDLWCTRCCDDLRGVLCLIRYGV